MQGDRGRKNHTLWTYRHRLLDMYAYEKFNNGEMSDYIPTAEDIMAGLKGIPQFPGNEI